ncbi:hypothetical protein [Streptomyces luteireticuli]|uniref:hypothetical protein n=1 Tax=Streptomyces luteireticuli TaxID=173858 RepID=UPI003558F2C7
MAAGDLDTSFGTGGKVSVDFGPISIANAVAVQGNQSLVLAGRVGDVSSGDWGVVRLSPNGSLDASFGSGGKVVINFTGQEDVARAVALQSDGKIVVGGFSGSELAGNISVARLNTDGTLDSSFGTGGTVTYDISGATGDAIRAMAIQPDGKILGAGVAGANPGLIRLNPDGSLDATFAGGGKAAVPIGNSGHLFALALLSTGKFLVAGFDTITQDDFLLARFNTDGTLDATFGTSGFVRTDFNGLNDLGFVVLVKADGAIVLGGDIDAADPFGTGGDIKAGWVRYHPDGSLDAAFGTGGKTQSDPSPLIPDGVRGLVLQNDGKIVAGGFIGEATGLTGFADPMVGDFGLWRLNPNGTLDAAFGTGGIVRTDFAGQGDGGRAIVLQTANKIVLVGGATTNHLNMAAARYKAT